ncbi:MAG: RIP metalloprotease RseP [Pseudomonadota bacterium]
MDIIGLIPTFGNVVWTVGAFILALSIIVFVHEYGHYIVGRWSGIFAEVFSVGFGPVIWSRTDSRGTKWQIAALPLGGYVKFLGDANAASAPDSGALDVLTEEERRHTMTGAPLWARAATVAAGPIFNFILSILVFTGFIFWSGVPKDPLTVDTLVDVPVSVQELQPGDEIIEIAGLPAPDVAGFAAMVRELPPEAVLDYLVRRDGVEIAVRAPHPQLPIASSIIPQSAAAEADLQAGDYILAIDGETVGVFDDLVAKVAEKGGESRRLTVWRAGEELEVTLTPRESDLPTEDGGFEKRYLIGISSGLYFTTEMRLPGVSEALGNGVERTWDIVQSSVSGIYHILIGAISTCNLQGPISIAETSGEQAGQGLPSFIWWIAVLSTAIGFVNLLPIPVLDGGHLVFHAWEAVTGRPPSEQALRVAMTAGLAVMLSLMVFALSNDLFCP